jgi:putative oxidoreductase
MAAPNQGEFVSFGETIAPFLGRLVLAWYFLSEAYVRAADWNATVQLLAIKDVPAAPLLHFLTLIVMVMGALSLFLGYRTRMGALMLFVFTLVANALMHDYWTVANPIERQADYEIFARNIAIAGGLLVLMGVGPGKFAMDNVKGGGGKKGH